MKSSRVSSAKAAKLYKHYKKKLNAYKMSVQLASSNANAKRKRVANKMSDNSGCLNKI